VKRSDRFIGIIRNSFIDSNKYFIIIFYDILLLNDIICIRKFYDKRRRLFKFLIYCISDRTDIGNREIIDFSFFDILKLFIKIFVRIIIRR
jgi:DNA ligase 4